MISISDPLALVAIQAGQVGTPTSEGAAAGGSQLDTQQRSVAVGEPVPIVFGRRRSVGGVTAGGVLISPGATEARFENDASNNVTAYYHLVLSEGQISSIAVKDVFQRSCRVGSHTQTYNRRAGTWTPANVIVARDGYDKPEASYYCGSVGAYPGMSTLSFSVTIPNGFDQWNRQVHCFVRGGMWVTRLYDNITGPSDNFADLVQWMLTNSGRVPTSLIDTTALDAAATFLEVNGFTCNCNITQSINYADLLAQWTPYFLLRESNTSGKRGLRPVLPTTEAGAIDTGAITPVWTFTEDHITAGSLEIQYSNLAERRPFVAQVIWRQQLEDDFGIIRTAEVRYAGTAETGPYESHDLSEFCTTENHAVKVGAYILSRRVRVGHTIRFTAKPQSHNTLVSTGDIIRVRLQLKATMFSVGYHDFLYQVERISKTLAGDVSYECTHFPINADGASLIALDVAAAAGTGILLGSNKTGVGCDINSSADNTIPEEEWSQPDYGLGDYPDWEWDEGTNGWAPVDPGNPNPGPQPPGGLDPAPGGGTGVGGGPIQLPGGGGGGGGGESAPDGPTDSPDDGGDEDYNGFPPTNGGAGGEYNDNFSGDSYTYNPNDGPGGNPPAGSYSPGIPEWNPSTNLYSKTVNYLYDVPPTGPSGGDSGGSFVVSSYNEPPWCVYIDDYLDEPSFVWYGFSTPGPGLASFIAYVRKTRSGVAVKFI